MMRHRMVFFSAMVGLLGVTLLGVVGASSSAGALPGQPASSELLEKTVARSLGTCKAMPGTCTVTWLGAATYCQTTYGAGGPPPATCKPRALLTRYPCGDCPGPAHVYCEFDAAVLTRCCQYTASCCPPPGECVATITGCNCVAPAVPAQAATGILMSCYAGPPPPFPLAPCTP